MKKTLTILVVSIMALSFLTGCAGQPAQTNAMDAATKTQEATDVQPKPTLEPTPVPTAELKRFAPADIFGSEFNPFYDVKFPQNFDVYGAYFDIGDPKFDGKPKYVLSMTAEGETDEAISFLSKLAAIQDDNSISKLLKEFNTGGFCEFKSTDGGIYTIRKTDQNDDRYRYVKGCHIDLLVNLDNSKASKYVELVKDNYNTKALSVAADYFDVAPVFNECGIYVNLHKNSAELSMNYDVKDVSAVQQKMAKGIKSNWYDSKQGKMGLSYGTIDLSILFDNKDGQIYIGESSSEVKTALVDYTAPDFSLTTLGFNFSQKDALCIYEDKEKGIEVAIHKPEWGSREGNWNIEFLHEVNGYLLGVWYYADEQKYIIQADKGNASAKYDFFIKTGEYGNEFPDPEKVKEHFGKVFITQDDNVYKKAVSLFEQTIQDRFGMSLEKLYALPVR